MILNASVLAYLSKVVDALNQIGTQPEDFHLHIELRDDNYTPAGEKPRVLGRIVQEDDSFPWWLELGEGDAL